MCEDARDQKAQNSPAVELINIMHASLFNSPLALKFHRIKISFQSYRSIIHPSIHTHSFPNKMSSFNSAKKLLPAKKAWKSFKIKIQSQLQKLKTSKAAQRTKNYCIKTLNTIRVLIPRKLYVLIRRSPPRFRHHFHHYHQHMSGSSSAIYVDELFPGHASMHASHHGSLAQPGKDKEMVASSSSSGNKAKNENQTINNVGKQHDHHQIAAPPGVKIPEKKAFPKQGCETGTSTPADAWKIPLLPQLRCVDERAEEFISKFRQEMKIEREKSIIDFNEMLARST